MSDDEYELITLLRRHAELEELLDSVLPKEE